LFKIVFTRKRAGGGQAAMTWTRRWLPAIIWGAAISMFSTHWFTSENTASIFVPFVHWLFPSLSFQTIDFLHHIVRKSAHVTEYFIFSLLVLRGIRGGRRGLRLAWVLTTIAIVFAYASLDEFHQSFVPGRTAAFSDVLIDTSGGALAQAVAALIALRAGQRDRGATPAG
jgi:VanZ family protein